MLRIYMADKPRLLSAAFFFLCAALSAAEGASDSAAGQSGVPPGEDGLELEADEALSAERTWQRFSWSEDSPELVLKYEVVVEMLDAQTGEYAEVRRMIANENNVQPDPLLPLGDYRFKVISYSLLGLPAAESDWQMFTIIKAFQPEIRSVFVQGNLTSTMYLDEYNDGVFSAGGRNLFLPAPPEQDAPSTSYILVKDGRRNSVRLEPEILEHAENNRSVLLGFNMNELDVGEYHLIAVDSSGLSTPADGRNRISVKFKKPFDLDVSVGYVLPVVMFDDVIPTYLGSRVYPLSAVARISFLPFKRRFGSFGLGLSGSYTRMSYSTERYSIDGNLIAAHLNFVYQIPIKRRVKGEGRYRRIMTLEAHGGAGGTYFCDYAFHFLHDVDAEPLNSLNISFDAGLAVQVYFTNRFYAEACMDVSVAVVPDMTFGMFLPSLSVGYQF